MVQSPPPNIGDTYNDLGATITGPQADLNLGIKTFLTGQLVSNIVVDTSGVATDTIGSLVGQHNDRKLGPAGRALK